jgi:hypothetical protein
MRIFKRAKIMTSSNFEEKFAAEPWYRDLRRVLKGEAS